jgi:hypothetical protein
MAFLACWLHALCEKPLLIFLCKQFRLYSSLIFLYSSLVLCQPFITCSTTLHLLHLLLHLLPCTLLMLQNLLSKNQKLYKLDLLPCTIEIVPFRFHLFCIPFSSSCVFLGIYFLKTKNTSLFVFFLTWHPILPRKYTQYP